MKKGRGKTTELVYGLAKPVADRLGLEIWDVRFEKEGSLWMLELIIDKPDGVNIADCEALSREIDPLLDEADPIEQSYCLEVSSAGIERELSKDWHFARCMGQKVVLKLIRPYNGEREYVGELAGFSEGAITLHTGQGEITFLQGDTAYVRLYAEF